MMCASWDRSSGMRTKVPLNNSAGGHSMTIPRWADTSCRKKSMSNRKRPRGRPSKYPPEFQRDAVAMVLAEGRAIAEVARAIGVNDGTLGNWVAKARRERSAGVELNGDERSELAELRAEVTQLRMERDLLKRSMAFWVKELAP